VHLNRVLNAFHNLMLCPPVAAPSCTSACMQIITHPGFILWRVGGVAWQ
jgi:hypothetical protein